MIANHIWKKLIIATAFLGFLSALSAIANAQMESAPFPKNAKQSIDCTTRGQEVQKTALDTLTIALKRKQMQLNSKISETSHLYKQGELTRDETTKTLKDLNFQLSLTNEKLDTINIHQSSPSLASMSSGLPTKLFFGAFAAACIYAFLKTHQKTSSKAETKKSLKTIADLETELQAEDYKRFESEFKSVIKTITHQHNRVKSTQDAAELEKLQQSFAQSFTFENYAPTEQLQSWLVELIDIENNINQNKSALAAKIKEKNALNQQLLIAKKLYSDHQAEFDAAKTKDAEKKIAELMTEARKNIEDLNRELSNLNHKNEIEILRKKLTQHLTAKQSIIKEIHVINDLGKRSANLMRGAGAITAIIGLGYFFYETFNTQSAAMTESEKLVANQLDRINKIQYLMMLANIQPGQALCEAYSTKREAMLNSERSAINAFVTETLLSIHQKN